VLYAYQSSRKSQERLKRKKERKKERYGKES
jgi:hypothetical protein